MLHLLDGQGQGYLNGSGDGLVYDGYNYGYGSGCEDISFLYDNGGGFFHLYPCFPHLLPAELLLRIAASSLVKAV